MVRPRSRSILGAGDDEASSASATGVLVVPSATSTTPTAVGGRTRSRAALVEVRNVDGPEGLPGLDVGGRDSCLGYFCEMCTPAAPSRPTCGVLALTAPAETSASPGEVLRDLSRRIWQASDTHSATANRDHLIDMVGNEPMASGAASSGAIAVRILTSLARATVGPTDASSCRPPVAGIGVTSPTASAAVINQPSAIADGAARSRRG